MSKLENTEKINDGTQEKSIRQTGTPDAARELDAVFGLLGSTRRRYLLYFLSSMEGAETTLEQAVEAVEAYETPAPSTSASLPARQEVRLALAHNHLPRLAAADILEYDSCDGTIRFHGSGALTGWLAQTASHELH